ncbi:hypothetical protein JTB14_013295 [Gonioctena quinquepunctata]|nr:hypothetical protein JTB14_013295 [Gonioctena quinquepunctata]
MRKQMELNFENKSITEELENTKKNLGTSPNQKELIGRYKWVLTKTHQNEKEKYKARLEAEGFQQKKMPEWEIYTPVERMITFMILLSLAVEWIKMDVKGALGIEITFIHVPTTRYY